ncbi:MAG TPA: PEP-CTERM sorting domain-containing protein [Terriglobales bacterium]|jgi:hypothetical protein
MRLLIACICLLALGLGGVPAIAQQDLYDNGPTDGQDMAWTINFGFLISDSFTLANAATVNGLTFAAWLVPGDVLETAEVSITSNEAGGTTYFDQTVGFTASGCFTNTTGFNVCAESGSFPGVPLNAGTYWLNLQNAVVNTGDPVYWDQNGGPSDSSGSSIGSLPSESFTILGSSNTGTGTTPEPSSLLLFASGIAGVFGVMRRKSKS